MWSWGHTDPTRAANYRHEIGDDRLKAVTEHVRMWLWPVEASGVKPPA